MRYLGLDLGTKRCGLAISDKNNIMAIPIEQINYSFEDYDYLEKEINKIIIEKDITDLIIGLPKNMDGTLGFASKRSEEFAKRFKNINIHFIDERLSSVEATNIIHEMGKNTLNSKNIIDSISASVILDTFIKGVNNEK